MTVASTLARKTFTGDAVTTSFGTNPMVFFARFARFAFRWR